MCYIQYQSNKIKLSVKTNLRAKAVVRGSLLPVSGSIGDVTLYTTKMEHAMKVGMMFAMKMKKVR